MPQRLLLLALLPACGAWRGPAPTFATFGNDMTKQLIKNWAPKPVPTAPGEGPDGTGLLPNSQENMKRFVRARILLEDKSTGCIATFNEQDDSALCVILTKFNSAEHQLILPLWRQDVSAPKTFGFLRGWHDVRFKSKLLNGNKLEQVEDREAWAQANMDA
jgi:hypothetical protein